MKSSARTRHRGRPLHAREPMHDVERVRAQIRHLAAGIIPKPAEMIEGAIGIIRPLWRRTEPHVVVEAGRWLRVGGPAETWRDVAEEVALRGDERADPAVAEELPRGLI